MTWKDVRNLGLIGLGILVFWLFSLLDDNSPAKKVFTIIFMVVFVLAILMYTPLGNPIKALIRKFSKKDD